MASNKKKHFLPKPFYPGGSRAMSAFIDEKLKYPQSALANKIEGVVRIRIAIDFKGKVIAQEIMKSLGKDCDQEASRVVSLLKFDVPTEIRKGKIRFHKTLNIHFRLPKPQTEMAFQYKYKATEPTVVQKQKPATYSYNIVWQSTTYD